MPIRKPGWSQIVSSPIINHRNSMPSILHTSFYFLLALGVLIAFHEYGHFIAARKLGVKVLRFSMGFGNVIWRFQRNPESTEFVVGVLPLGGYVKMVDEREGEVEPADLPFAFNRQNVLKRSIIVVAGPAFNFVLAILIYWLVFMIGETGMRPVLGAIPKASLAAAAGFSEGDEILTVAGTPTPTWNMAISAFLEKVVEEEKISFDVRTQAGEALQRVLTVPREVAEKPELLHDQLGFHPWQPPLSPVVDKVEAGSAAQTAGLLPGDLLVNVDGVPIKDWQQWVEHVRAHPKQEMILLVERDGVRLPLPITPAEVASPAGPVGRIGAGVRVPEEVMSALEVEYQLDPVSAFTASVTKTVDYSVMTLKMIGRMLTGSAAIENLSGPISIAQYAGQSARLGVLQFMKFLAIISISLAVLNLLPIPVLDGGHLMFYAIEAVRGSPVSEQTQVWCQQVGMFILFSLMALAFFLDIERLFR